MGASWDELRQRLCEHVGIEWLGERECPPETLHHSGAWFNTTTGEHTVGLVFNEDEEHLFYIGATGPTFSQAMIEGMAEALHRRAPYIVWPGEDDE